MKQLKTNLIDQIFSLLLVAKILHLEGAKYTYTKLAMWYFVFFLIGMIVKWILDPETAKKFSHRLYVAKNNIALKKAKKESDKIVEDARKSK